MNYSDEEALREVLKRSHEVKEKRRKRTNRYLAVTSLCLITLIIITVAVLPVSTMDINYSGTVYGSFLLSREAGGYVLVGLISFVLGIVVTLLCINMTKDKHDDNDKYANNGKPDINDNKTNKKEE